MRKLAMLTVAIFATCSSFAQNTLEVIDSINISREQWRDNMFRMDKNQVPTGFLQEYSLFGFESAKYDGLNNNDDTIKNDGRIFELHSILWHSKVNGNASIAVTDSLFKSAFLTHKATNVVPLTFIYQPYNRIRQSALSEGLFTIASDDMGILDVPGRSVSPYDPYEIFAFAPFKTEITQFNAIQFTLPNDLFYMQALNSVEVDFGDGAGFRYLAKGGSVSIYYSTNGFKYLTARINTPGGTRLAKSRIHYQRPTTFSQSDYTMSFEVAPVYTSDNQYFGGSNTRTSSSMTERILSGSNPGANVEVINGCDLAFNRPIIIVEGFDPVGSLTTTELNRRFRDENFIATMRGYGYDFVFVDFTNNTDYIENNARVLEAVINWVNQTKTGTFRSSVIGFSMGGLIARWCLRDMEERGLQHLVENYFSYDAPHQGANITLGMQYIFSEMARDLPFLRLSSDFRKLSDAFKSPAARQMLVTYADYDNSAFNWNPSLTTLNPLRAAFAQRLQAKGYPTQCRNFGMAYGRGNNTANTKDAGNGAQFTAANPFGPQTQIFQGDMIFSLINVSASANAVPENNIKAVIANYRFYGWTYRRIFGLAPGIIHVIRVRRFNYTGQYPYDDAPGSFEKTQTEFAQKWVGGAGGPATTNSHHGHNFLATASALDLTNQSYSAASQWQSANMFANIDNQILNRGQVNGNRLANPALSPFLAVMTGTSDCGTVTCSTPEPYTDDNGNLVNPTNGNQWNHYHNTDITAQAARFIERNILNAASVLCAGGNGLCNRVPNLSGPTVVCATGQYDLLNLPSDVTIIWQAMNGRLRIDAGQGTSRINVTQISTGAEVIQVTITNSCGASLVRTLNVNVGPPAINIDYTTNGYCNGTYQTWSLNASSPGHVNSWLWTVDNSNSGDWYIDNPNNSWTYVSVSGGGGISVTATNACGSARTGVTIWSNCDYYYYSVSPNPATDEVIVSSKQEKVKGQGKASTITELNIYDQQGMLKMRRVFNSVSKASLRISHLPIGVYFIEIVNGSYRERQQLTILK